jgi:hypothetical protein
MRNAIPDPIFVRGMSRSGGTLLVTLLDAHRDIAMSYELYPTLLEDAASVDLASLSRRLKSRWTKLRLDSMVSHRGLRTFLARCDRGGLSLAEIGRNIDRLLAEGLDLSTVRGRLRLIELIGLEKMSKSGKSRWGMKCNNSYEDYAAYWARPCFLNIIRDGRDVLASQLNTGSFNKSPGEVAAGWVATQRRFESFMREPGVRAKFVRYEDLTSNPEPVLRDILAFLELEFDPATLQHEKLDLTVFKASHLSKQRITQGIDTTKIGRWRRDLSPEQLGEFMAVAGNDLVHFGYTA